MMPSLGVSKNYFLFLPVFVYGTPLSFQSSLRRQGPIPGFRMGTAPP